MRIKKKIKLVRFQLILLFLSLNAMRLNRAYPSGKYIPPEIYHDEFSEWITKISKLPEVKTLIEIGSSSGEGSTSAIVKGLKDKKIWQLHLLEIDELRFEALRKKFLKYPQIFIHRYSSVSIASYADPEDVSRFYKNVRTNLNLYPIKEVQRWLADDKQKLIEAGLDRVDGIELVKKLFRIDYFDFVLIDGSEFSGFADFNALIGGRFILLDDINTFKCHRAYQSLLLNPGYKLEFENWHIRNGFAVFSKNE
jgi:hypothetical protein